MATHEAKMDQDNAEMDQDKAKVVKEADSEGSPAFLKYIRAVCTQWSAA
jgi:hypothetical protein